MEFKIQEKWRVQKRFSITEKEMDLAIKRMIKRHPLEDWIEIRYAVNGEKNIYLKQEFVCWLEEVYFNEKYYLDVDIEFFRKQIFRLENELNISHKEFKYETMTIRELCNYFNKSIGTIYVAINRMRKNINITNIYLDDGRVMIPESGVKWLNENYFRESYLKDLEVYKLELQKRKMKIYG